MEAENMLDQQQKISSLCSQRELLDGDEVRRLPNPVNNYQHYNVVL